MSLRENHSALEAGLRVKFEAMITAQPFLLSTRKINSFYAEEDTQSAWLAYLAGYQEGCKSEKERAG